MLPLRVRLERWLRGGLRPSHEANRRTLAARGWTAAQFVLRDLREADIPALAELHAVTWAATYPMTLRPPTAQLREWQWRKLWGEGKRDWFCLVLEAPDGSLVGFLKGERRPTEQLPEYGGHLSKIYLRWEYHGLGLGRRLMAEGARRFLAMGIGSMLLFADEGNPTCEFYLGLGGHNLPNGDGTLNLGNFGWKDLRELAAGTTHR